MKKNTLNPGTMSAKRLIRPVLSLALGCFIMASCSTGASETATQDNPTEPAATTASTEAAAAPAADESKGVGPVTTVDLGAGVDEALAGKGKAAFEGKCTACHKFGERYVGPDLAGVTERRKPEWILNMILNPQEMTQQNTTAKELLGEFMTQMPNQNLTQEEARAVLEYFRTKTKNQAI
jgi:mono/diheme cytochrome c family protein